MMRRPKRRNRGAAGARAAKSVERRSGPTPTKLTAALRAKLVRTARESRTRAYAPYSSFRVGAALLGASGRIYPGANIENISFGLTVCAERTALWSAWLEGEREFVAVAVATDSNGPVQPCGACRQVLREFADDLTVVVAGRRGPVVQHSLNDLLPDAFFNFTGAARGATPGAAPRATRKTTKKKRT